ncbi:sugar-transfer associated ATP-grasp domain-containing protein [Algibacter mikhailovii]|uniref:Alpha-L-glutamate ligase-related protein ATP-grasp domain-containing protein n=1 Tax=Algibacter mikhailovii TaxID=425498 RepID=A0A918V5B9_9FLAO|nr:sugar-transfer associated ATP-grasp domain-containing protein [Algibacter mikhailovii]GGZ70428.1 hypothetical protein GCM10007028_04440 [Algibacter mikhailovii]
MKKITLLNAKYFFVDHIYSPITKWHKEGLLRKKIKGLLKIRPQNRLSASQQKEVTLFYQKLGIDKINTSWHRFYSGCNGQFSPAYVPENLFYINIEPKTSVENYVSALGDKNLLDILFGAAKQPETIFKNMNGFLYHNNELISMSEAIELCNTSETLFIKPTTATWGGKNVRSFSSEKGITDKGNGIEELFAKYKKNYIVQKKVIQHESMSALNATSLNTFRIMSYLNENEVTILSTIVRMGKTGSVTDNGTTGGISCGVQSDGSLNKVGFQLSGESILETDSGIKFADIKVPFVEKMKQTVKTLHKISPFFKIISWDLAIDNMGDVILIEYNIDGQGINIHQLNNGPVLAPLLNEIKNNG